MACQREQLLASCLVTWIELTEYLLKLYEGMRGISDCGAWEDNGRAMGAAFYAMVKEQPIQNLLSFFFSFC
jgi:hypothetical protein